MTPTAAPQLPPPDPLLIEIVKALAIKAAREDHAAEMKAGGQHP
jgi:hypothetical protein